MTITVLIATFNRARLLDECLTHLARQSFNPDDEIIVIDNGSTDDTPAVIERHRQASPVRFRTAVEARPGKSIALSRAIGMATGDVLALTDDDVNVGDGWIEALRRAMADDTVALVGGPVAPRWERKPPRWLRLGERYGRMASPLALLDYGSCADPLDGRAAVGANLAVRRRVFETLGGFAPHLGKRRGTLLSGEDHDLCVRVERAGLKSFYCPDARVMHWVPASRMRLRYFVDWFFWSGITHAALDGPTRNGRTVLGVPLFLIRRFAGGVIGLVAAVAVGDTTRAVDRALDAAFAAGYASACWGFVPLGPSTTAPA